ncbi:MAG: hypothetical protein K6U10_09435 [Acidobacteriia bacterium]|nr:hypothetical protein [Methyloceanibacter sp.]MCL6492028.1 hypothetical protein [Terriglobia bacterium]
MTDETPARGKMNQPLKNSEWKLADSWSKRFDYPLETAAWQNMCCSDAAARLRCLKPKTKSAIVDLTPGSTWLMVQRKKLARSYGYNMLAVTNLELAT